MPSTTHQSTDVARRAALLKIERELRAFADRPDLCQPRFIAEDIRAFLDAERSLHGGNQPAQIGYFMGAQIGALANLRISERLPIASLSEACGDLAALTRDLSEHRRHNHPPACALGTLLAIAATAQRAAEDCGLTPRFSETPTNPLTA